MAHCVIASWQPSKSQHPICREGRWEGWMLSHDSSTAPSMITRCHVNQFGTGRLGEVCQRNFAKAAIRTVAIVRSCGSDECSAMILVAAGQRRHYTAIDTSMRRDASDWLELNNTNHSDNVCDHSKRNDRYVQMSDAAQAASSRSNPSCMLMHTL
ncbi:hypothetical protein SV7mr_28280 [Stieleria bergensis]|uniref:Uncharacterized protein n=1 Tax=Stieleria bergensis TaxID=2528025 RepID=A0A517SW05_9BACT|nr:hypothetical protein SV7mr_28280 [Planctomycetes bacterium SV_7m_r]